MCRGNVDEGCDVGEVGWAGGSVRGERTIERRMDERGRRDKGTIEMWNEKYDAYI